MFERFALDSREAVTLARDEASALGSDRIASEHVLLAAARLDGVAHEALATLGVGPDDVAAAVRARHGMDDDALASIGVDLGTIRAQVEATFGAGALDAAAATSPHAFTPDAKKLLELVERLRPTLRFDSVEELVAQMHDDVRRTRAVLAGGPTVLGRSSDH